MKVCVVGSGYVGLVTGTCFAETGNEVCCVDIDQEKVKGMQNGKVPIYEPGLDDLFERNIREGRLTFTTSLDEGVLGAEAIFLALPTPPDEDGSADLSYIMGVAKTLGGILNDYAVVINKSTVPVGTAEKVRQTLSDSGASDFDVVSNPEFLREGRAIEDFQHPDRIVVGTTSTRAEEVMRRLYAPFTETGSPLLFMDQRSAELTKYGANALLATKITFMNELANLAERAGANIDEVRRGIGSDPRIGSQFLFPGIGYGGSCFPKDVDALARTSSELGYGFRIIEAVSDVNDLQKLRLVEKASALFGDLRDKVFAVWGLAFKPDTDDIREAPSLYIIDSLLNAGASLRVFDPEAMGNARKKYADNSSVFFCDSKEGRYEALERADALLIVTEWPEFRSPDFLRIKGALKTPIIFDGRNIFDLEQMDTHGFYYESIGRPVVNQHLGNQNGK